MAKAQKKGGSKNNIANRGAKSPKKFYQSKEVKPIKFIGADGRNMIAAQFVEGGAIAMENGIPVPFSNTSLDQ